MKSPLSQLLSLAAVFTLASCTVSTPQTRIERNYSLFESLPAKHRELVQQGRITKGMSKSGVYLALGNPARKGEGYRDGASYERWDYTRLRPVYYNTFHGYYGHGWGHRHGHHHGHYGYGWSPSIEYVPYRSSSVLFRKDVVSAWETFRPAP